MDRPGMCASSAKAEAVGPACGACDELAWIISSLTISAKAPMTLRFWISFMGAMYM